MTKNRTEVADIDRSLYDFTYGEEGFERLDAGITPDIVREISAKKDEPQWMLDLRLKSLEIFNRFPDPTWGSIEAWTWTTSSPTSSPTPTKSTTGIGARRHQEHL